MTKNCLDTYALWEIQFENLKYAQVLTKPFTITTWTLTEFYKTMLKQFGKEIATMWYDKFKPYCEEVEIEILIKAVNFQDENKKEDMSLFDCVGYTFSLERGYTFVTGDKAFKDKKGVLFIKK